MMLIKSPSKRPNVDVCLKHDWFKLLQDNLFLEPRKSLPNATIKKLENFYSENKLKQGLMQFIAAQAALKEEEESLRNIFSEFDQSNRGTVTKEAILKGLQRYYGEYEAKVIHDKIVIGTVVDKSGSVLYNKFNSALITRKESEVNEKFERIFRNFGKNGNGTISLEEIQILLGDEIMKWKKLVMIYDKDNDGLLNFNEFKNLLLNYDNGDM